MINWKKVGDYIPTNVNKLFKGCNETPFVSCIVWLCNPLYPRGGVCYVVRWDTEKKCWHKPDMRGNFLFDHPYEITHFCDDINMPSDIESFGLSIDEVLVDDLSNIENLLEPNKNSTE